MLIDIKSQSVTYEDIGSTRRTRTVRRRRTGTRRKNRVQPKDRASVMKRKVSSLRSKIKSRLDKINGVSGKRISDPSKKAQLRQEVRSLYQDYKRTKMIVDRMKK